MLGLRVDLLTDMGAYLQLLTPGIAAAGSLHVPRDLQVRDALVPLHRRVHQQDAHRRLPRRRAAGGDLRDRAGGRRPGRRARARPDRAAPPELDRARRVPVHHGVRARRTTPGTTRRPPTGRWRCSTTTGCAPSRPDVASPATPCSWASASRRTPRCAASRRPAGSARRATSPAAGSGPPCGSLPVGEGRGGGRYVAARPGARHHVQPDHRRRPGPAVRRRRGHRQRHGVGAVGAGHLRLPVAGRRRHRGAPRRRGRRGEGEGARRAPAGGERRRPRVRGRHLPGEGHALGHQDDPGARLRLLHLALDGARQRRHPARPTTWSTPRRSPTRTAPTCAPSRSTPRPA